MYSRTILLAAASLAVAGMAANASPMRDVSTPMAARAQILATLHVRHYRLLSEPYFFRGRAVVRSVNPFGRVVLVEIDPRTGGFIGETFI